MTFVIAPRIKGFQGIKGDQGDQGIQGIQGIKGDQGDRALPPVVLTVPLVFSANAALGGNYIFAEATVTDASITPSSYFSFVPTDSLDHSAEESILLNIRLYASSQNNGSCTLKAYCTDGTIGTHNYKLLIYN